MVLESSPWPDQLLIGSFSPDTPTESSKGYSCLYISYSWLSKHGSLSKIHAHIPAVDQGHCAEEISSISVSVLTSCRYLQVMDMTVISTSMK